MGVFHRNQANRRFQTKRRRRMEHAPNELHAPSEPQHAPNEPRAPSEPNARRTRQAKRRQSDGLVLPPFDGVDADTVDLVGERLGVCVLEVADILDAGRLEFLGGRLADPVERLQL